MQNKPKIGLKDVIRTFWSAIRHHKVGFYFSIGAVALGTIFELASPLFYKKFFDLLSGTSDKALVAPELLSIIFIVLTLNILAWITFRSGHFAINAFESRVMARLQQMSFDYMIDHSYSFFSNNFTGSLVQRINRHVRAFEKLYDTLVFNFVPLLITITGVIYVVWKQEPRMAVVIICWAIAVILFSYFYSIWKLKYDVASAAADSKATGYLADAITNQNTIASFAASDFEAEGFAKVTNIKTKAARLSWDLSTLLGLVQAALGIAAEFFLFYFAIKYWQIGIITIGTFVLIQAYVLNLVMKLWNVSNIIRAIYEGFADSKEMVEILTLPHEIKDAKNAPTLKVSSGQIEFDDIDFTFPNGNRVLESLNLSINEGEKVALIGPSGAGKSTVVKLLLRMYDLTSGVILIDDQDISEVTQDSLRKSISLVPQDPVLFHRTLMENIRYGKRDATDEEVVEAARLAHCDEFIESLPDKYNTFVGERGIKLSGGERQRVAIARAILKNAPILILDEATSSLDSHSESLIQDALDELMKGKTVIVVAHRLSTIRKMDRIIVIEKGKVIEEGTHDDLISRKQGLYKSLWSLQAGGFLLS